MPCLKSVSSFIASKILHKKSHRQSYDIGMFNDKTCQIIDNKDQHINKISKKIVFPNFINKLLGKNRGFANISEVNKKDLIFHNACKRSIASLVSQLPHMEDYHNNVTQHGPSYTDAQNFLEAKLSEIEKYNVTNSKCEKEYEYRRIDSAVGKMTDYEAKLSLSYLNSPRGKSLKNKVQRTEKEKILNRVQRALEKKTDHLADLRKID